MFIRTAVHVLFWFQTTGSGHGETRAYNFYLGPQKSLTVTKLCTQLFGYTLLFFAYCRHRVGSLVAWRVIDILHVHDFMSKPVY